MKQAGLAVGVVSGLLVALAFVAGANALGPSLQHIDLVPSSSASYLPSGSSQAVGVDSTAPTSQLTASQPKPISSLDSLSSDGGANIGLLFIPILVGVVAGGILYAVSARRVDSD